MNCLLDFNLYNLLQKIFKKCFRVNGNHISNNLFQLQSIIKLVLLLTVIPFTSIAQINEKQQKELVLKAEDCFENENYSTALSIYSQLLSLDPKDPFYNYKMGICHIYHGKNKNSAIEYLLKASKDGSINNDVFYYLGQAYHYNYQFDEAIANYEKYKQLTVKKKGSYDVSRLIEMCNNGKQLLKYIHGLKVYDRKEVLKNEFYKSYDIGERTDMRILSKPRYYKSKLDEELEINSIIFVSDTNNVIFYSSYGADGSMGKDIYRVLRLPDWKWGEPERLDSVINTKYDEEYPYFDADGFTLYFSSRGHNSMGGYDIFKSIYNEETGSWSEPVNLDFPINSTSDDIFYLPDATNKVAYFASDRNSPYTKYGIYSIKVPDDTKDVTVDKGILKLEQPEKYKQAKISVYSLKNDSLVGIYKTNTITDIGKYVIILPSGEYRFFIEHEGFKPVETIVDIPTSKELIPVTQIITLGDELKVVNNFRQHKDKNYRTLIDYVNVKSRLEINSVYDANGLEQDTIDVGLHDKFVAFDNDKDGVISMDEVNSAIDAFFDNEQNMTVRLLSDLVDYFLDQ